MKARKMYYEEISRKAKINFYKDLNNTSLPVDEYIMEVVTKMMRTVHVEKFEMFEAWFTNLSNELFDEFFKIKPELTVH